MHKKPQELSSAELDASITSIAQFYDFSFFGERDVDISLGLTFALEHQACSLGLVNEGIFEDQNYDTAVMMGDFVTALDSRAMDTQPPRWMSFRAELPYLSHD